MIDGRAPRNRSFFTAIVWFTRSIFYFIYKIHFNKIVFVHYLSKKRRAVIMSHSLNSTFGLWKLYILNVASFRLKKIELRKIM